MSLDSWVRPRNDLFIISRRAESRHGVTVA